MMHIPTKLILMIGTITWEVITSIKAIELIMTSIWAMKTRKENMTTEGEAEEGGEVAAEVEEEDEGEEGEEAIMSLTRPRLS